MANNQDNRNRLQLNFGFSNQQSSFTAEQARAYPTTPSTFPQPFPNAAGQQEVWGAQSPATGINQQGYFSNFNPYQGQYQSGLQSPAPVAQGYRSQAGAFNEVTNGFAQQLNLGGSTPRSASPYHRQHTPNGVPRPRTGNGQRPQASYLNAPPQPSIYDDEPPPKNPEKYSAAITERVRHQKLMTAEFFKENVERAKNRNERYAKSTEDTVSEHVLILLGIEHKKPRKLPQRLISRNLARNKRRVQCAGQKPTFCDSCAPRRNHRTIKHLKSLAKVLSVK